MSDYSNDDGEFITLRLREIRFAQKDIAPRFHHGGSIEDDAMEDEDYQPMEVCRSSLLS